MVKRPPRKCRECGQGMERAKDIDFHGYKLDGWKCACGEVYFDMDQAKQMLRSYESVKWNG